MLALRKLFGSDGLEGNLACVLLETVWTPHIQNCHLTLSPQKHTIYCCGIKREVDPACS